MNFTKNWFSCVLLLTNVSYRMPLYILWSQAKHPIQRSVMKSREIFIVKQIVVFSVIAVVLGFLYG